MSATPHVPMDDAHLEQYALNTAQGIRPEGSVPVRRLYRGLGRDLRRLQAVHRALTAWAQGQTELPGAAEWLLDNHYLALREGRGAQQAVKKGRPLRGCAGGTTVLQVCAQGLFWAVPGLEEEKAARYLSAFQQACPLNERELSLLVPALAGAVVDRLTALADNLEQIKAGEVEAESLRCAFQALRTLSVVNWGLLLEEASGVEEVLRQDPSGHYPDMDEDTRRRYRQQVCRLARRRGMGEVQAARRALELARDGTGERAHIGWYLFRQPLGQEARQLPQVLYGGGILVLSAGMAAWLGWRLGSVLCVLLLVFPLSDIVKNCVDFLVVRLVRPRFVPRMALKEGIPREGRTLCVVVSLLTGQDSGGQLSALLERYRLANRDSGSQLCLGLLCDLPDRDTPMDREGRRWVRRARAAVDGLNAKYGGGFYLFFRTPAFNPRDERYQGWERKRGALLELVRLLKGRESSLRVLSGQPSGLADIRYVITLDGDTSLNVGTAREMVGAMLHPLNQPKIDREKRIVTQGYALFQPRVSVELEAANRSFFSRTFAGQGGVDPYGSTASDVYHDLFGQGTYTGKGIFQVDAFYTCLDRRFPDNAILSHDLLEGSYLRAGLLGEVELSDGFPYKVHSYFARLHRWVRGDWQLLPWLGRRVPDGRGGREENPLPALAKWKIVDNLRRSLSPVFTLLALVLGICFSSSGVLAAAGGTAVLAAASNLLLSGAELCARRGAGVRARYHSTVIAGLGGTLLQTLLQLLFLPYQAWVCLSAILTALWRMLVSHRRLLSWVTAAQTERGGGGVWFYVRQQWFSLAVGLATMLLAPLRIGRAVGLCWMAAPMIAWYISRPAGKEQELNQAGRAFLLHQATLIWRYFADFLRPEDHYLPPDNWQEQPNPSLARRTSPTNMGMALLSLMAAADLDLTDRKRAVELIGRMLDTIEGLEKWHGHLYNWYDTAAARPLHPRYVSTVDSGNLAGCLIALGEGLHDWGEEALARRARRLEREMEFSRLYDGERRLFSVGFEVEKDSLTPGWYDLMASEARQTSYLAVARGAVDPRHWRRLGRMLLGENDYSGMASWTGTMFEYFMPNLLLPCEKNSLMYESLAFCLYAQRRQGERRKMPWGVSESGFYAFDPGMNYQYKAHGVPALGLKRGLEQDQVVAPYATFLALLLSPAQAVANLRRLRDMGLEGQYGLYEAVDFTPSRVSGPGRFEVVRSYMSHHLGMSLIAIDNALNHNVMQRRFMADCEMAAYRELLQERLPVGAPLMRNARREGPEKPRRLTGPALDRAGEGYSRLMPECHLVSNGSYTIFACDNGITVSSQGKNALLLARPGQWYAPGGVSAFLRVGGRVMGLTPAPLYGVEEVTYGWEFYGGGAAWTAREGGLSCRCAVTVPRRENGELRRVEVEWSGEDEMEGELLVYLEPVLCSMEDYLAHPAFARLFVESTPVPGGVLFRRRPRGGEEPPVLCILWEGEGVTFTTSREEALGRGGLRALACRGGEPLRGETGGVLDPCLLLRLPVGLASGEHLHVSLALAVSDRPEAAQQSARRILEGRAGEDAQLAPLVQSLGLEERRAIEAFRLLKYLSAVKKDSGERPPQSLLWPFGISGDLPIALGEAAGPEELEDIGVWCAQHQLLSRCGWSFDLVLLGEEGGDYRRPLRTALADLLKTLGAESALGARGGVHLLPVRAGEVLERWAAVRLPLGEDAREEREQTFVPPPPVRLGHAPAPWHFDEAGNVVIETGESLPPVGWSQVLCNPRFGWLTDETGNGLMWGMGNAREGRLTPWKNDPLAVGGDERLTLALAEGEWSVFADGDGLPCTVTYGPGFGRWEKRLGSRTLTTLALVPPETDCRILAFSLCGGEGTVRLHRLDTGETLSHPIEAGRPLRLVTRAGETRAVYEFEEKETGTELQQTMENWERRVSALTVQTPDQALNRYLSAWSLYQVAACRLFARTSQYQNGGAFGFRDQLQDVCALLYTAPELAREQLVRCAGRQFEEGDVQHWWHPPQGAGVRTRISDDLLWLPYVLARYVSVTGDAELCREETAYLTSPPLAPQEQERYETPAVSAKKDTLYRHACLALDCSLGRGRGRHGLALMGGGDWNDGMNRVGEQGKGESVWLTWFTALVLENFASLCARMGDTQREAQCRELAGEYRAAGEQAWDGAWYLRGYYDDGTPLGSSGSGQCQIDSIAQSFAVLAGTEDRGRANQAMSSALDRLFDREHQLVKLFTPPFTGVGKDPGYIRGYLPGVRENGGQYTHAAVWLAMACLRLDRREEGWQLLRALLPAHHPEQEYRAEPYVLAADVYSASGREGRGGWSWYTGAAGWYWRAAVEELLGLQVEDGQLFLRPRLPDSWPGFEARWELDRGTLEIIVRRGNRPALTLDGQPVSGGIALKGVEGTHRLEAAV